MPKTKKEVVYIAGPIRNIPLDNVPAFKTAAVLLRAQDYKVISPIEMDIQRDGAVNLVTDPRHYATRDCKVIIKRCDVIYLLKGWSKSVGSIGEAALARWCKLRFIFEDPKETKVTIDFGDLVHAKTIQKSATKARHNRVATRAKK